jgi:aerotaxis receptor
MKINLPVTNIEHHLDNKRPVVSKTDLKGMITYANPALIEISGYTREELIGHAHNILRHPDMPPEAFADLWNTLKQDQPWRGLVKNRCKNGDFYWVEAYATPLFENGRKVGYMSVRNRPDAGEVKQADALYRAINQKLAKCPTTENHGQISMRFRLLALTLSPFLLMGILQVCALNLWINLALSFVLASVLAVWVWSGIKSPLAKVQAGLAQLSEGNFHFAIDASAASEFLPLLNSMQSMQIHLRAIIADIVAAAGNVSEQSDDVHQLLGQVVARGKLQSAGGATVASALDQLSVSVHGISEATQRSAHHAEVTMKRVDQGVLAMQSTVGVTHELVHRVLDAQTVLEALGKEISSIEQVTQTIKDIADQTNLLALNAAIEAARAGEAGRGFAVVADEVRKLAERTTLSTVEIAATISRIVEQTDSAQAAMHLATGKVEESTHFINESHAALEEIKDSSCEVSASAKDIAQQLMEQNESSAEVSASMVRMGQLIDENSQSMAQADRSMGMLSGTAEELHLLLEHFERNL